MKKIFSFLLLGLLLSIGNAWATDVLTLDCATPAAESSSTAFSSTSDLATFLNSAAGLSTAENKIACSAKGGDVYNGKGSGGGNIPQKCLKIGKASGPGSFTFTIPDNFDQVNEIEITCYGWKTSSSISINGGAAQTFTTAQVEATKTFELASATRTIAISVTSSAVCVTEIVLKKSTAAVAKPTFTPAEGNYTFAQNVTIACATDGASIYYTLDGTEPTSNSTLYSSAISITETKTIKAIAKKDDAYSAVASATYSIFPVEHAGTQQDPYTVADARNAIDANIGITNIYATGIVSEIVTPYNSQYGNISYNISTDGLTTSDQLQAYRGKSYNGDNFTGAGDIQVGDVVVVYGTLKKYNDTYEFDQNNQLVSLNRPAAVPVINAENVELAYNATSGEIAYTISNATEATLTAASTTDWISNIQVAADKVTFTTTANEGNIDREGFITLSYTGAVDKVITVTQAHYVIDFATLPFAFNGGRDAIANVVGLTQTGLGTDYTSSPKLKFDGTGDNLILKINEAPETLTFDIKGNGFSGGTFKVQTSADGVNYEDLETYAALGDKQSEEFDLTSTVRYIKWIYTSKSDGNVALGNIAVSKLSTDPEILLSETSINVLSNGTLGENITVTFKNITEVTEQTTDIVFFEADGVTPIADQAEPDWVIVDLDLPNNHLGYVVDPNTGAARYAYLKVYALDDEANDVYSELITISQDAYVPAANYVIVTDAADIMPGAHYIIASGTNGGIQIMGGQKSNNREGQAVTAVDGVIDIPAGVETHEFVICKDGDKFAIYEAGVGYLYAASSSSNYLKSQATNNVNGRWEITIDGEDSVASIIATESTNRNVMRYNSGSGIFASYASATQSDVYLYRKTGESFTTETVTVSAVGYATLYYGTENLIVPEGVVARTYKVESGALVETETYEAGEVVPKTIAVVLEGAEGIYDFIVTPVPGMGPAATNLKGSDVATTTTGGDVYYGLSLNSASQANSVGFYWMAENGAAFTNGAHKAYLAVNEFPASAPERILFHDNNATNIQNVEGAEKAVKVMENGKRYIQKNGVDYDAMGKTVR